MAVGYTLNDDGSIAYEGDPTPEVKARAEKAAAKRAEAKLKPEVASAAATRETGTDVE